MQRMGSRLHLAASLGTPRQGLPAVGKGGVGLPLPPDALDLPLGVLQLPMLLQKPARPASPSATCHVPPAKSWLAIKFVRKGARHTEK